MSADTPSSPESSELAPAALRREALLPNERGRGLGTVAIVCTMAGVASGLALATTLMAMQVADSMSSRTCAYSVVSPTLQAPEIRVDTRDYGFLGIRYGYHDGFGDIDFVLPNTPAAAADLRAGDHVLAIDGSPVRSLEDLRQRILHSRPGATPDILIERDGVRSVIRPTLMAWPAIYPE